uniref:[acyl-carrier-protein] S-malonyltransferase n=1 Tax=Candidatus Endobugula sertula TaxID=62101 RepID=A2CLL7_9GAMM|nr:BryP [Candidatus Endobugula sertula]
METIYLFPGQGSQHKEMGKYLFDKYPELIHQADQQLHYSIKELCLEDPDQLLNKTQFTQPALYIINALSFLEKIELDSHKPSYVAGHSLGEYNALFAAGAFDFLTGLKLVKKRGLFMEEAPKGAMAAIIGITHNQVKCILEDIPQKNIDIANINSEKQFIISGLYDEIIACENSFTKMGANFILLNVSAAFHSRYMKDIEIKFEQYLQKFQLNPLRTPVISNYSARPYPKENYRDYMVKQISHPVKWYESISWLIQQDHFEFEEVGPGRVLTNLTNQIKKTPLHIKNNLSFHQNKSKENYQESTVKNLSISKSKKKIIFMYSGQGSQYYQMGKELYDNNSLFRHHMNYCSNQLKDRLGVSLIDIIYDKSKKNEEFDNIIYTNPVLYIFGYSLTQVLIDKGIKPDAFLGHSLGEYIAATVAGIISLEDGLNLILTQAQLLEKHCNTGKILNVFSPPDVYYKNQNLFFNTPLACVNFSNNFSVSGYRYEIDLVKKELDKRKIFSSYLPVSHGFHSHAIDPIENYFKKYVSQIKYSANKLPIYSCYYTSELTQDNIDNMKNYLWEVIRNTINFEKLISSSFQNTSNNIFIDTSPNAALSNSLKHGFNKKHRHFFTINQFGKNIESINHLINNLNCI